MKTLLDFCQLLILSLNNNNNNIKVTQTRIICFVTLLFLGLTTGKSIAQTTSISGRVISEGQPIEYAHVAIIGTSLRASTDSTGKFKIKHIPAGTYKVQASYIGFLKMEKSVIIKDGTTPVLNFDLTNRKNNLNEVVVSGTLKEISRVESTVPVEVYNQSFFKKIQEILF